MTTDNAGQTRRRLRVCPATLLITVMVLLTPDLRHLVLAWIGYALALLAGGFIALVMLTGARTPPRR